MLTPTWTGPNEVTFASSGMASIVPRALSSESADRPPLSGPSDELWRSSCRAIEQLLSVALFLT